MHIYLLKKESCTTYAVLAKDDVEAIEKLISYGEVASDKMFVKEFHGYSAKRFIDGQDGDIFNSLKGGVEISYCNHSDKRYIINAESPAALA